MVYGLCGASGVGKTTLAQAVSENMDIPFLKTSITEVALKNGFDPVAKLDLNRRMELQIHLLNDHIDKIAAAPRPIIVDRTPIDMIGYLLAEFNMHSHEDITMNLMDRAERYVEECLSVVKAQYDFVFLIGKLTSYTSVSTRPVENPAYARHFDLIMRGAMSQMGNVSYAFINTEDLGHRCQFVEDQIATRLDTMELQRKKMRPH